MEFNVFMAKNLLNPNLGSWVSLPCDPSDIPKGVIVDTDGEIFTKAVSEMTNVYTFNKILQILNNELGQDESNWEIFKVIYKESYDNKNLFDSIRAVKQVTGFNFKRYDLSHTKQAPTKVDLAMEIMDSKLLDDGEKTLLDVLLGYDIVNIMDIDAYIEQESIIKVSDTLYITDNEFNDDYTDVQSFIDDYVFEDTVIKPTIDNICDDYMA